MDNAVQRINRHPADSMVCFVNTYPLDSVIQPSKNVGPRRIEYNSLVNVFVNLKIFDVSFVCSFLSRLERLITLLHTRRLLHAVLFSFNIQFKTTCYLEALISPRREKLCSNLKLYNTILELPNISSSVQKKEESNHILVET